MDSAAGHREPLEYEFHMPDTKAKSLFQLLNYTHKHAHIHTPVLLTSSVSVLRNISELIFFAQAHKSFLSYQEVDE